MQNYLELITAFPTAVFTVLLGVVVLYWLAVLVGWADLGHAHAHVDGPELGHGEADLADTHSLGIDLHHSADSHTPDGLAGVLKALGLTGVPITVVISLAVLLAWAFSALSVEFLLPLMPKVFLVIGNIATLFFAPALALPAAGLAAKPLRGLFVVHRARNNSSLIGATCKVITLQVTPQFGRAEVILRGSTSINVRIWCADPNTLTRGDFVEIVAYDDSTARYQVSVRKSSSSLPL